MKQSSRGAAARLNDPWLRWPLSIAFLVLMALVALGPALSGSDSVTSGEGSPLRQGGYLAVVVVILLAIRPWKRPSDLLSVPLPITLAIAICAVSAIWAIDPNIATRRVILTAGVIWAICTLVDQLGYREMLNLVRITLIVLLAANFVTVALFPEMGIHHESLSYETSLAGDWRGIMIHKNNAGAACAITILFFVFDTRRLWVWARVGAIAAAFVFLVFTQSKTSVGMALGAIALGYMFQLTNFRFRAPAMVLLTIVTLGLMVYLNIYQYAFYQLATDPVTFTGRATIWRVLLDYSEDHLWLGSGYGSFWAIGPNSPVFQYSNNWVNTITSGHNGYLDLVCQVGLPLAIAIVGLMLVWPFFRLILTTRSADPAGGLLLALLTFCAGHNMTESTIMQRDMLVQVVLVLAVALLWKLPARSTQHRPITDFGGLGASTATDLPQSSRSSLF